MVSSEIVLIYIVIGTILTLQVNSEKIDFKKIFHKPKDYDKLEILERSSFEPDDPIEAKNNEKQEPLYHHSQPKAIANAQVLLNFDNDREDNAKTSETNNGNRPYSCQCGPHYPLHPYHIYPPFVYPYHPYHPYQSGCFCMPPYGLNCEHMKNNPDVSGNKPAKDADKLPYWPPYGIPSWPSINHACFSSLPNDHRGNDIHKAKEMPITRPTKNPAQNAMNQDQDVSSKPVYESPYESIAPAFSNHQAHKPIDVHKVSDMSTKRPTYPPSYKPTKSPIQAPIKPDNTNSLKPSYEPVNVPKAPSFEPNLPIDQSCYKPTCHLTHGPKHEPFKPIYKPISDHLGPSFASYESTQSENPIRHCGAASYEPSHCPIHHDHKNYKVDDILKRKPIENPTKGPTKSPTYNPSHNLNDPHSLNEPKSKGSTLEFSKVPGTEHTPKFVFESVEKPGSDPYSIKLVKPEGKEHLLDDRIYFPDELFQYNNQGSNKLTYRPIVIQRPIKPDDKPTGKTPKPNSDQTHETTSRPIGKQNHQSDNLHYYPTEELTEEKNQHSLDKSAHQLDKFHDVPSFVGNHDILESSKPNEQISDKLALKPIKLDPNQTHEFSYRSLENPKEKFTTFDSNNNPTFTSKPIEGHQQLKEKSESNPVGHDSGPNHEPTYRPIGRQSYQLPTQHPTQKPVEFNSKPAEEKIEHSSDRPTSKSIIPDSDRAYESTSKPIENQNRDLSLKPYFGPTGLVSNQIHEPTYRPIGRQNHHLPTNPTQHPTQKSVEPDNRNIQKSSSEPKQKPFELNPTSKSIKPHYDHESTSKPSPNHFSNIPTLKPVGSDSAQTHAPFFRPIGRQNPQLPENTTQYSTQKPIGLDNQNIQKSKDNQSSSNKPTETSIRPTHSPDQHKSTPKALSPNSFPSHHLIPSVTSGSKGSVFNSSTSNESQCTDIPNMRQIISKEMLIIFERMLWYLLEGCDKCTISFNKTEKAEIADALQEIVNHMKENDCKIGDDYRKYDKSGILGKILNVFPFSLLTQKSDCCRNKQKEFVLGYIKQNYQGTNGHKHLEEELKCKIVDLFLENFNEPSCKIQEITDGNKTNEGKSIADAIEDFLTKNVENSNDLSTLFTKLISQLKVPENVTEIGDDLIDSLIKGMQSSENKNQKSFLKKDDTLRKTQRLFLCIFAQRLKERYPDVNGLDKLLTFCKGDFDQIYWECKCTPKENKFWIDMPKLNYFPEMYTLGRVRRKSGDEISYFGGEFKILTSKEPISCPGCIQNLPNGKFPHDLDSLFKESSNEPTSYCPHCVRGCGSCSSYTKELNDF